MAMEKVSIMVLKVDLQCPSCYKKAKKTLGKFPQVRDQIYDEKANTITIKVVCCSPEKILDKLCCKGGKAIKSITIKEPGKPEKPKEPAGKPTEKEKPKEVIDKPKEKEKPKVVIVEPKDAGKPKNEDKPKSNGKAHGGPPAQKPADKPKEAEKPKSNGKPDKPKSADGGPPAQKPADKPKEAEKPKSNEKPNKPRPADGGPLAPQPADNMPQVVVPRNPGPMMMPFPVEQMKAAPPPAAQGVPSIFPYVGPSYDGYAAGPYYHGYGYPAPPPQQIYHDGYYGYEHAQGHWAQRPVGNGNRFESTYDENPQICSIM